MPKVRPVNGRDGVQRLDDLGRQAVERLLDVLHEDAHGFHELPCGDVAVVADQQVCDVGAEYHAVFDGQPHAVVGENLGHDGIHRRHEALQSAHTTTKTRFNFCLRCTRPPPGAL